MTVLKTHQRRVVLSRVSSTKDTLHSSCSLHLTRILMMIERYSLVWRKCNSCWETDFGLQHPSPHGADVRNSEGPSSLQWSCERDSHTSGVGGVFPHLSLDKERIQLTPFLCCLPLGLGAKCSLLNPQSGAWPQHHLLLPAKHLKRKFTVRSGKNAAAVHQVDIFTIRACSGVLYVMCEYTEYTH